MRLHLTDVAVRSLKPTDKQVKVWDTQTLGFGVRVNGQSKTWFVMFGKRRAFKALGRYPHVTLAEARKKALLVLGSDHDEKQEAPTFDEARTKFIETRTHMKPRSLRELTRTLNRHFTWKKTIDKITSRDVAGVIDGIDAPSEAAHAFKDIRTFFNWCVPRYLPHSPCAGLKSPSKYVPRKRVLTDAELASVWAAAERAGHPFGTILKLLILTGQRYGEIVSLQWSYVLEKSQTITFPDTKNGWSHTIPYNGMVAEILEGIPRLNSTPYLFPSRDGEKPWNGAGKAKHQLEHQPPIRPWTLHDLRRTASTTWARLKIPPHIIERLLNHKLGTLQGAGVVTAVADVYNQYAYMDEMREAIEKYDAHLQGILRPA